MHSCQRRAHNFPARRAFPSRVTWTVIATSCQSSRRCSCSTCRLIQQLEHWLWDWRSVINISEGTAVLLKTARRTQKSRPLEVFGEEFQCAGRANYRNQELIWLTRISDQKAAAHRLGMSGPFIARTGGLSIGKCGFSFNRPCLR